MKPRILSAARLTFPLATAIAALLASPSAHAATLTWDNTAGGAINDGAGAWHGAGLWNNAGTPSASWTSGDNAIFGNGGVGGPVTLASPTTVGSLTINAFITTAYTLGTSGQAITLNAGITKNASSAAVSISSPLILGAAQTWTNNSGTNLTAAAGINNGGFLLTIGGSGGTVMNTTANIISGSGGLTKNGTGMLTLGGAGTNPVHTYSGTTTISAGILQVYNMGTNGVPSGNLTITGGVLQDYFGNGGTFSRALGSGTGQVQITGGTSGFSGAGSTSSTFNIGGAAAELVWGSTFFSPSVLALQSTNVNVNGKMSLANKIDLAGTTRTITVLGGDTTGGATLSGVIRTATGTAGITKTGVGNLILSAANTFNGATTISGGWLTLTNAAALQNSALDTTASVTGTASVGLRTTATTLTLGGLTGNKNFAATGGVFSSTTGGYGTVTALTLNPATGQTPSYSGIIANGATGTTLAKSGAGTQSRV